MRRKKIPRDDINELDIYRYDGDVELIENTSQVARAYQEIKKHSILGIDTETKPSFRKNESHMVCLLQIATPEKVFLFRLQKTGLPNELVEILENPSITKVGIAFHDDIIELNKWSKFNAKSILDLNIHCKNLGFEAVGVRNLAAMVLSVRISKRQQTSNWEAIDLSPSQVNYAATDAWICREIFINLPVKADLSVPSLT